MNGWLHSVSGGGSRCTVAPATATTRVSWRAGLRRRGTQAAGYQNLMTASLVAKNDSCAKTGVDAALI
jgi:hypothetical protein